MFARVADTQFGLARSKAFTTTAANRALNRLSTHHQTTYISVKQFGIMIVTIV